MCNEGSYHPIFENLNPAEIPTVKRDPHYRRSNMLHSAIYMRKIAEEAIDKDKELKNTKDRISYIIKKNAQEGAFMVYIYDSYMGKGVKLKEIRKWLKSLGYKVSRMRMDDGDLSLYIKVRW